VGAKGLRLAGLPRSGETSRPDSRDPVASGVKCVDRSRCRVAAHDRSLHAGFAAVHHKTV
jgi:hypothetical protein